MESIGSISNIALSMYEWTPIIKKSKVKLSEQLKQERELLFHGKLDIVNKVLDMASKYTGIDKNVLLNIDNDKKNKYCGIMAAYLVNYHGVSTYSLIHNYGGSKNMYYWSKNYDKLLKKPVLRMLYYHLVESYE